MIIILSDKYYLSLAAAIPTRVWAAHSADTVYTNSEQTRVTVFTGQAK
jgi:hypothetical protein